MATFGGLRPEEAEKPESFATIIKSLDAHFKQYDARVQLPSDFDGYFNLQRKQGQTLLSYVSDHSGMHKKLENSLPSAVQGWHLLRQCGLTREQKQLVTLRAPSLDLTKVTEALYLILGQDYKQSTLGHQDRRWHRGKGGRAYMLTMRSLHGSWRDSNALWKTHHSTSWHRDEFNSEETIFTATEEPEAIEPGTVKCQRHLFNNKHHSFVTSELHDRSQRRVIWEVYSGKGRPTEIAESMGGSVRTFDTAVPGLATASLQLVAWLTELPVTWEVAAAADDEKKQLGSQVKLMAESHQEAVRVVQRLHRSLGHPTPEALTEMLESRGVSDMVVKCAREYKCVACARYKKPDGAAAVISAERADHVLVTAITKAETDRKLRRVLLRKYRSQHDSLVVGQLCHFWRDARAADLVKIRWHGPARVVMVETDDGGRPRLYWVAFKTQLIRAAPHHVRPNFENISADLDGLDAARRDVEGLRSRGVTRFLDLSQANRRNIDDEEAMDDDDDAKDGGLPEILEPPTSRRRFNPDAEGDRPGLELPGVRSAWVIRPRHWTLPILLQGVELRPSMRHQDQGNAPGGGSQQLQLDPSMASLYETAAPGERFRLQRQRLDQQGASIFGPIRRYRNESRPYDRAADPGDGPTEGYAQAFDITGATCDHFRSGWHSDDEGTFTLTDDPTDYWEVKAGCVIRHHLRPRRSLFKLNDHVKTPVDPKLLDGHRTTVLWKADGTFEIISDKGTEAKNANMEWTGCTIFQITGKARRELGMFANLPEVGQQKKVNKGGVNERHLSAADRASSKRPNGRNWSPSCITGVGVQHHG
eukprot:s1238_g18.t1